MGGGAKSWYIALDEAARWEYYTRMAWLAYITTAIIILWNMVAIQLVYTHAYTWLPPNFHRVEVHLSYLVAMYGAFAPAMCSCARSQLSLPSPPPNTIE